MARLGDYYRLCALIDSKSLLGVTKGKENDVVNVTLGKNIATKCKLSNQKQLHSWRTREKFTSPIIFDSEQSKYAAVFNHIYVRLWSDEDVALDKLKRYKFNSEIYTLFTCNQKSFILFKNGSIFTLSEALKLRRTLSLESTFESGAEIFDFVHTELNGEFYIGILIRNKLKVYLEWTISRGSFINYRTSRVLLEKHPETLSGYAFHKDEDHVYLLSLWSDGKMFSNRLEVSEAPVEVTTDLYAMIDAINCKHPVSIHALDESYVAIYGADCNEEGAHIIIYNVQFKVIQSRQPLKMFTHGAKLWCIESNLFLAIGQNLAVIPYHLDKECLKALVGSHKNLVVDPDVSIVENLLVANWTNEASSSVQKTVPKEFRNKVLQFRRQGLPESLIAEAFLQDILEKGDLKLIAHLLDYFYDIPDRCVVQFFKIVLKCKAAPPLVNGIKDDSPEPPKLKSSSSDEILDKLLSKPFRYATIIPLLRSLLSLDDVLALLEYIYFLLSEDGHPLPSLSFVQTVDTLTEWCCVLFDANFQRLLLTKDEKVQQCVTKLKEFISSELESEADLRTLDSLLSEVCKRKDINKNKNVINSMYSVELVHFY